MENKTKKRNAAATKERILRAAMSEFGSKGYGSARIAKIVKRAGCNIRLPVGVAVDLDQTVETGPHHATGTAHGT